MKAIFLYRPIGLLFTLVLCLHAQYATPLDPHSRPEEYRLGPGDQVTVHVVNMDEIQDKPYSVDAVGNLHLPVVGDLQVGGMTSEEIVHILHNRLSQQLVEPDVTVSITNFHSQPVTVLGAVDSPGVHQLEGHKTLLEMISMAGGLREDAGYKIKLTRKSKWGRIPLPSAVDDPSGAFSVASINVKALLDASNPQENIDIKPEDVISVPRGELIYVLGAVKKPGGLTLGDNDGLTALQVISLADGLDRFAAPRKARILRPIKNSAAKLEIPIDIKQIIDGKGTDVQLRPNDVLVIPTNGTKAAVARGVEAAILVGTSAAAVSLR